MAPRKHKFAIVWTPLKVWLESRGDGERWFTATLQITVSQREAEQLIRATRGRRESYLIVESRRKQP